MIFNTYWFICFCAAFFPVYWLLLRPALRMAWLLGGCVVFHFHFAGPAGVIPILIIGFCMSELVSAYPTAGGIYWWAGKLGGPVWAWFTGWFNLIGLVAVVASVDYAAATFLNVVLGLYEVNILGLNFGDEAHVLQETFVLFALILLLHATINIRNTHLLSRINSFSVWWHVIGVAAIVMAVGSPLRRAAQTTAMPPRPTGASSS